MKWINTLHCGDCIEMLQTIDEPLADLIFADPPFNIGYGYDRYNDTVEHEAYVRWTEDWMAACLRALKPAGSFYIAIGDDYAAHVRLIGERLGLTLRNWIIWHYTFGQQTKAKFARSHTHIFYFVADPKQMTFNDDAVRVPSDRQLIYNDKRANPAGKMPDDVWNTYSRVCGTFKERQGWHPCQMPELLLARIIAVSSNPGDVVLDPFNGSGTTIVTAKKLGRRYIGIDISPDYIANAQQRLDEIDRYDKSRNGRLDLHEDLEFRRLFVETGVDAQAILNESKLQNVLLRQFHQRMNNSRTYTAEDITPALKELLTWKVQ